MDRRDFLKFFGAGATVIPVVAGMPATTAAATLVAPPSVEPVEFALQPARPEVLENLADNFRQRDHVVVTIDVWSQRCGHQRFVADSVLVDCHVTPIDVTSLFDPPQPRRRFRAGPADYRFTVSGVCTGIPRMLVPEYRAVHDVRVISR